MKNVNNIYHKYVPCKETYADIDINAIYITHNLLNGQSKYIFDPKKYAKVKQFKSRCTIFEIHKSIHHFPIGLNFFSWKEKSVNITEN